MWKGPYGDWGSKKYLVASLDQSLKCIGLDCVNVKGRPHYRCTYWCE